MNQLKKANRMINNLKGGGFDSAFGDNKPHVVVINNIFVVINQI